ncbi:MAG: DUF3750 domain-containing protein [Alphaproteobacteria bacterium]
MLKFISLMTVALLAGPAAVALGGLTALGDDWRTASREPVGMAPDPADTPEPVIQVYGARAFHWRGAFAVHTWISVKRRNAAAFTTYEVIGWRRRRGLDALAMRQGPPDRQWFGSAPEIYVDLRGDQIETVIDKVEAAVTAYPYKAQYRTWPGPNSNTFTAHIARAVPELGLDLPPTAIGKDFLGLGTFVARSPSGTGFQVSLFGLLGVLIGIEEGIEFNLLGLAVGVDPLDLTLRLPGWGRLGPS